MRISLSWLADFLELNSTPQATADALTAAGLEVEGIEEAAAVPGGLAGVVVGRVLAVVAHPGADRLRLCQVDVGAAEPVQIVCGAANVAAGQLVPVAMPGAVLHPTGAAEPLKIKAGKIRGEVSAGMICAEDELGLGTGHEGILVLETDAAPGTPAAKALKLESDFILEIGLTPNRGDAASHLGVARDLYALQAGAKPLGLFSVLHSEQEDRLRKVAERPKPNRPATPLKVSIQNPEDAPHYHAVRIDGVNVGLDMPLIKRRLASIGIASINHPVDVTNYMSHYLGQPMHAFDADKVSGGMLEVRRAGMPAQLTLLDKRTITLHPDDLVIADASGPIALAGAMGGASTAVDSSTKNVILEVACFNPIAVRKTAARHGIKTDASFRFERGVDPAIGSPALEEAQGLIAGQEGQANLYAPVAAYGMALPERSFFVTYTKLLKLIGQELDRTLVEGILTRLGFGLSPTPEGFTVTVPSYRLYDVEGLADIAEEVIRIYGLNNLALPGNLGVRFFDTAPGWKTFDAQADIARQLAGEGFVEIITNSLTAAGQEPGEGEEGVVRLLNPLSEELSEMRRSPLPATLEAIAYNANRRQKAVKTFEFGRVYSKKEAGGYSERAYLCLAVWGQPEADWRGAAQPYGYADVAASLQKILARLGVKAEFAPFDYQGQMAEATALVAGKRQLAVAGEVAPALHKKADLKGRVFAAILWWDELLRHTAKPVFKAVEPPRFPEVRRDLSLVVDAGVTYAELKATALEAERKLLRDVALFDIFAGPSLGEGKKAYALAFTLADAEATLTDRQIDGVMERLEKHFVEKLGAVVRR